MAKLIIPRRFVRIDSSSNTVAIRKKKSGRFAGRRRVKKGKKSDGTNVLRVIKDVDVDGDNRTDFFGGTIIGRNPRKIKVRAGKRNRSFMRTI